MKRFVAVLLLLGSTSRAQDASEPVDYYGHIQPLFAIHCTRCHGPEVQKGGLRLDVRERALKGGDSGSSGLAEALRRATSKDSDEQMPPKGPRLGEREIEHLRRWIDAGAPWPDRDAYWAFQPARTVTPPPSSAPNPVDAFIDAGLKRAGIAPAAPADRRTLLRRAYADLIGMPPSPEEADAFLQDARSDAWPRLIDRLLSDPRYGERWARYWLDLARYSESDGYEDDKIRPLAWRYRDYVIRSFNADKPFDRFVHEQIAGDELFPGDADAWIATGFVRLGAWDGMSKEPRQQRQDYLNDATDAVGSVFLGMTVGCARCHDHKYDRITQVDYYGLQAFFVGTVRETRDLPAAPVEPAFVTEAHGRARRELDTWRGLRDALRREAREQVLARRRCDVAPDGEVRISDDEINRMADVIEPKKRDEYERRIKELEKVERLYRPAAEVAVASPRSAPKTFLLRQGQLSTPGQEVVPRFVESMVPPGRAIAPSDGGRRTALARWLTSPEHPLTSRVLVNRVWQRHFGRGLVATPSDFGRNGRPPSHPDLLDWLARRFVADGWSLKSLHRLLMTSAAYRRDAGPAGSDPANVWLGRMSRRRLDAEALRDSILSVSGRLSPVGGGPGVYVPIPKDINVMLPNNDKELSWERCTEEEGRRRTIYVFQRRSLTLPFVDVFDGPSMNQTCPQRPETTVAPQALTLFNGDFCREEAKQLADRVRRDAGEDVERQIDRAFRLTLIRSPRAEELKASAAFLKSQPLSNLCHVLLNTNEFLYVD